MTKILSIRVTSVAKVLAIVYAFLGFINVPLILLCTTAGITLPLGILGPPFFLNLNLNFPRPEHFLSGILTTVAACAFFSASGWLTGAAAATAFNIVARRLGGIEVSSISATPVSESSRYPVSDTG